MNITIISNDWGSASNPDIAQVLLSVQNTFLLCFNRDFMNPSPVRVDRVHGDEVPWCNRIDKIIYLNAEGCSWAQFAYQFSHEYCHFQILHEVQPHIRWFEESLCELASYFFLPLISELWQTTPPYESQEWKKYAPAFIEYVRKDVKKHQVIDLNFSNALNPNIDYLMQEEYDRGKNAYVAIKMLPIFNSDPTLWSAVPLIGNIPDHLDFYKSLQFWNTTAPSCYKQSIEQIAEIFSLSL